MIYVENSKVASRTILSAIECYDIRKTGFILKNKHTGRYVLKIISLDFRHVSSLKVSFYNLWGKKISEVCNTSPDLQKYSNYTFFSFCRNPFDRLASAYTNKIAMKSNKKPSFLRGQIIQKSNWKNIDKEDFENSAEDFHTFVKKYVTTTSDEEIDIHFKKQYSLLFGPQKEDVFTFNFIGRFENFSDDWNTFCATYNIPKIQLQHLNKSHKMHYSLYYTNEEIVELVTERYQEDINFFDYKKEADNLLHTVQKNEC